MKKMLATAVTALAMSATVAMAAPAAPVFNAPVKVSDGKIRNPNNKVAIDGTNVYAALEDSDGNRRLRIAKSSNSGVTWGLSAIPTNDTLADIDGLGTASIARVAVGIDPAYPTQKIVHALWRNDLGDVMYSYFSTRPNQTGWSEARKISDALAGTYEINAVVTSNGALHVLVDNLYTTATTPDAAFTTPRAITPGGNGSLIKDSTNNLFAVTTDGTAIYFTKKLTTSPDWSASVVVSPVTYTMSGYITVAVANTSTMYVGYADSTASAIKLAVSTNGGNSWTTRNVLALPAGFGTDVAIAVTTSKVLTLVAQTGQDANGNNILKVFRTNDNGVSWSTPVTIQADGDPIVELDASNKAMILARSGQGGQDWAGTRSNPNANVVFIKEK